MVFGPVSDSPDERVHDCTTRQQNAHIIEQREVLYRWHPWHGRKVSIVAAMTRGGVAIFRCHADDGRRALEIPQWMFDAATCCRMPLAPRAVVACRALYDVRHLIQVIDRIPSIPMLDAEPLVSDTEGGAQATPDSHEVGQQLRLFAPIAPLRWTDIPIEARARTIALLARLLRQHTCAHRAKAVRDE